ncbi:beta-1,3-galactosyltransferase 6-like [Styela clava]
MNHENKVYIYCATRPYITLRRNCYYNSMHFVITRFCLRYFLVIVHFLLLRQSGILCAMYLRNYFSFILFCSMAVLLFLWFPKALLVNKQVHNELAILDEKLNNALLVNANHAEIFLLVIITTSPEGRDRRDAIRETWLMNSIEKRHRREGLGQQYIKHYFVFGTAKLEPQQIEKIKEEQRQHDDLLLLEGFAETYGIRTEKLALTLIHVRNQFRFKYVFKANDFTFARIDILYEELKERHLKFPTERLYYGYFYGNDKVKKKGPQQENDWQLCDTYIPYALGGVYIISSNIVDYVANNFYQFKRYVNEDVSLGAWLAPLAVHRIHDKRFDTEYKSRGCSNTYIVSHKQSIQDMKIKQKTLETHGNLCRKEVSLFRGYEYNWDAPSSQCCERTANIP